MIFKSIDYSHNVELTNADVQNVVNVEMCKSKYTVHFIVTKIKPEIWTDVSLKGISSLINELSFQMYFSNYRVSFMSSVFILLIMLRPILVNQENITIDFNFDTSVSSYRTHLKL